MKKRDEKTSSKQNSIVPQIPIEPKTPLIIKKVIL